MTSLHRSKHSMARCASLGTTACRQFASSTAATGSQLYKAKERSKLITQSECHLDLLPIPCTQKKSSAGKQGPALPISLLGLPMPAKSSSSFMCFPKKCTASSYPFGQPRSFRITPFFPGRLLYIHSQYPCIKHQHIMHRECKRIMNSLSF